MFQDDTIAALATPPGEGGIGIIRLSGNDAFPIIQKIFSLSNKRKLTSFKNRYLYYGYILDNNNEIVDEVLMVCMESPRTYTRENIVEIHCHGGMVPINNILKLVIKAGARCAQPGEFTKRAFLNGRIDLSQAEGIMDLIVAKTEEAAKTSLDQMQGSLSQKISSMRNALLDLLAHIEVTIDYPEEDIENVLIENIKDKLNLILEEIHFLLASADQGRLIREGIKTVIIGKPNVGKSSLLNALLRENRAIVTDVPGTTRDVIEEYVNIKGILVRIMDTAGIRETIDLVESIGVEKSKEYMKDADLVLMILDASQSLEKEDSDIITHLGDQKALIILNKTDKPVKIDEAKIIELAGKSTIIKTSILEGTGLGAIEDYIYNLVYSGQLTADTSLFITNSRHKEALINAESHLYEAIRAIDQHFPLDIITIDISSAWKAMGEIIGESLTENLIDKIFSEFCLGK